MTEEENYFNDSTQFKDEFSKEIKTKIKNYKASIDEFLPSFDKFFKHQKDNNADNSVNTFQDDIKIVELNKEYSLKYLIDNKDYHPEFKKFFESDIAKELCNDVAERETIECTWNADNTNNNNKSKKKSNNNTSNNDVNDDVNNATLQIIDCKCEIKRSGRILWNNYLNNYNIITNNNVDKITDPTAMGEKLREIFRNQGRTEMIRKIVQMYAWFKHKKDAQEAEIVRLANIEADAIDKNNEKFKSIIDFINDNNVDDNTKEARASEILNQLTSENNKYFKQYIVFGNPKYCFQSINISVKDMTREQRKEVTKQFDEQDLRDMINLCQQDERLVADADNDDTDNTNVLKVNLDSIDDIEAAMNKLQQLKINKSASSADPSNTTEENNEHKQEEYEKIQCAVGENIVEYTIKINETCYCLGCHKWHQIHKDGSGKWGYSSYICQLVTTKGIVNTSQCERCGSYKEHTAIENLDPKSKETFKAAKLNCEEINVENEDLETLVNKVMLKITKDNFNIKDLTRLKEILPNYDSPDVTNKNRNVVTVAKDVNTSSNQIGDDINQEPAAKIDTVQTIDSKEKFSKDDIKRDLSDEDIKNIKNLEEISKNPYDRIFTKLSDPQNSNEFDKKYFDTSTVVLDGNGEQDMFEKLHMSIFYDTDEEQEVLFTNNGLFNLCMSDIYYQLMKDNTVWLHSCYKMDERDQFKVKKFKVQFKNDVIQANQISQISLNLHQLIPYISNNDTILYDRVLSLRYNKQVHRRIEFIEENSSDEKKTGEKRKGKGGRTVGSKKQKQETKK